MQLLSLKLFQVINLKQKNMKKPFTKTLFLFVALTAFVSHYAKAQTGCNYTFTYTVTGKTITFNNTPDLPAGLGNTIIWTINTTQFATTNDPTHTVATSGTYIVCMAVIDITCLNSPIIFCDTVTVTSNGGGTVGVSEKDLAKSVSLFPNPSNGKVNLVSDIANVENISVYNAIGEIVLEDKKPTFKNELDLTTLPNGVYIVKIKTEAGFVTKKLTLTK